MRLLLLSLFIVSNIFALNDVSKPYNFLPRDTLKSSKFNANYDTLYLRVNQNNDSIDRSFIRFYDLEKHDSTLKYFEVDTIRSNPNIDSITGNVVITGIPTVTGALKVDSLNSTKGITSTGRLVGTDADLSDSLKAVTGTFSGAVTGTTGTFSGAISGTTLNTGNGANELFPMDQDVRTTASVTHDTLTITKGIKLGTGATGPTPTPYNINLGTTFSNNDSAKSCKIMLYNGNGAVFGFGVGSNNDVQYHTAITSGTHRLYVDNVEKFRVNNTGTITTGYSRSDSITTNGTNYFKYVEGTFPCTLKTSDVTVQQIGTAYYVKNGRTITISFPYLSGTSNSTGLPIYCRIPYYPSQLYSGYNTNISSTSVLDNGVTNSAQFSINSAFPTYVRLSMYSGNYTSSGIKGVIPFSVTYITD